MHQSPHKVTPQELIDLDKLHNRITILPRDAFIRIETVSDFRDAVFLLLSGWNVGCEPVAGVLSAFPRPTKQLVIRQVMRPKTEKVVISKRAWRIRVYDHPKSIADGFAEILRSVEWTRECTIDVSAIEAGRGSVLADAFTGFMQVLNLRAHRILSTTDIVDLMEWVALAAPNARLDIQLPYGHGSWGWFIRREPDTKEVASHLPDTIRSTRSLVCHIRPDSDDLDAVLIHAARMGVTVGIINGKACAARVQGFRGTGPDKATLLPNYGSVLNASLDMTLRIEPARWEDLKLVSRHLIRESLRPMPLDIADAWQAQADFRHLVGLSLSGDIGTRDDRNHSLNAAIKMSDALEVPQPALSTCQRMGEWQGSPVFGLVAQQSWLPYADHNAGLVVPIRALEVPAVADWLLANWDDFRAADFRG